MHQRPPNLDRAEAELGTRKRFIFCIVNSRWVVNGDALGVWIVVGGQYQLQSPVLGYSLSLRSPVGHESKWVACETTKLTDMTLESTLQKRESAKKSPAASAQKRCANRVRRRVRPRPYSEVLSKDNEMQIGLRPSWWSGETRG